MDLGRLVCGGSFESGEGGWREGFGVLLFAQVGE